MTSSFICPEALQERGQLENGTFFFSGSRQIVQILPIGTSIIPVLGKWLIQDNDTDSQSEFMFQQVCEKEISTGFSEDMKKSVNFLRGRVDQDS